MDVREKAIEAAHKAFWESKAGEAMPAAIAAYETAMWQPIDTAPKDKGCIVYAPADHGLPSLVCYCRHDTHYGWCVDELREATHWRHLPEPPKVEE